MQLHVFLYHILLSPVNTASYNKGDGTLAPLPSSAEYSHLCRGSEGRIVLSGCDYYSFSHLKEVKQSRQILSATSELFDDLTWQWKYLRAELIKDWTFQCIFLCPHGSKEMHIYNYQWSLKNRRIMNLKSEHLYGFIWVCKDAYASGHSK